MTTDTTTPKMIAAAGEAYKSFERTQRGDETITTLRDDAPSWVTDMVYEAHGNMLPDDWRYEWIREACAAITDAGEDSDLTEVGQEFADGVDVYTGERLRWLASNLSRADYCDEAQAEGLAGDDAGVIELIGLGQYMERLEVFASVSEAIADHAEETEDDEDEE
jgi:hypothetical protein